jgi:hypothetical protein
MAHYYKSNGETAYKIPAANGKLRDTTIRDAKKLGLKPSVTTIMKILDKPSLNRWQQNQILEAAVAWPYTRESDEEEWRKEITSIAGRIGREASTRGNELHDKLEKYYKDELELEDDSDADYLRMAIVTVGCLAPIGWIAEESFCTDLFGGKVDLHNKKENFILDFKTKATDDEKKMKPYDEHVMQLAAYRVGLDMPDAICYNLFISTVKPGLVILKEWTNEEIDRGWEMFSLLCKYWYLSNNYVLGD